MAEYLDKAGLDHFWSKIKSYVDSKTCNCNSSSGGVILAVIGLHLL